MLIMVPTKHYAGVTLCGDYYDLHDLYETISHIVEEFPYSGKYYNFKNYALSLCCDIRHAYEGHREIKKLGYGELDKAKYYGVNILFPVLLFQYRIIKWFMGFTPTNRNDHANMFKLEHCIEEALKFIDSDLADQCMPEITRNNGYTENFLTLYIDHLSQEFALMNKKERKESLFKILCSMNELSGTYYDFLSLVKDRAKELKCELENLDYAYEEEHFVW